MASLRARFTSVSGHVDVAEPPASSSLELVVATCALECAECEDHLRSAEHLDVARHPTATMRATSRDWTGGRTLFHGPLTIVGVTNEIDLDIGYRGPVAGGGRAVFAGAGSIDRESWGLTWNVTLAGGQALVARVVDLDVGLAAVRQPLSAPSTPGGPWR
jgi:polyisoprenoid-binding protein YceI